MLSTEPWEESVEDRLVLRLDAGGPVELKGLTDSFAALARFYERHYRNPTDDNPPRLFITKISTGSLIAEIVPFAFLLGQVYPFIEAANTISDFTSRLMNGLKAFAGIAPPVADESPSEADAHDLREFVKPLTGKRGASLGIKHARFSKTGKKGETTVAEYTFDESEINRAAVNIDNAFGSELNPTEPSKASKLVKEVMLYFERASRAPGKVHGKATDWAIIPDVSPKALPTYFRESIRGNLKDVMIRGDVNPLTNVAFIVDAHVQLIDGAPKAYIVTEVHATVPLDDPARE